MEKIAQSKESDLQLTESKRRVITLLRRYGPMTKRDIVNWGLMAWATVVKAINQLGDEGIIATAGTSVKERGQKGKYALLYTLTNEQPLAIGVDVEYKTTRIVLTNLAGSILKEKEQKTPQQVDSKVAREFLSDVIGDFISDSRVETNKLAGIGIGVPGIGFASSLGRDNIEQSRLLQNHLTELFRNQVRVATNTKAYAMFEKWTNETFAYTDFIFVSIRTGVGTGIVSGDELYTGAHGLAGEIGHLKVVPNGPPCRCGSSGCLETVVNQSYLYEQYRINVLKEPGWSTGSGSNPVSFGLADLFSRAKDGDKTSTLIVETAAGYLGRSIANAIMILDITNIIISGNFGEDGGVLISTLKDVIRENILPRIEFEVRYVPFDPTGHVRGAALLVLKDYFVGIPRVHVRK